MHNDTAPYKTEVSRAIAALRRHLNESQEQFAHRCKLKVETIAQWEDGKPPRGRMLARLARLARVVGANGPAEIFNGALNRQRAMLDPELS